MLGPLARLANQEGTINGIQVSEQPNTQPLDSITKRVQRSKYHTRKHYSQAQPQLIQLQPHFPPLIKGYISESEEEDEFVLKEPEMPKNALSGFEFFVRHHLQRLTTKYNCKSHEEAMLLVSKRWKALKPDQREIYNEEAATIQKITPKRQNK